MKENSEVYVAIKSYLDMMADIQLNLASDATRKLLAVKLEEIVKKAQTAEK